MRCMICGFFGRRRCPVHKKKSKEQRTSEHKVGRENVLWAMRMLEKGERFARILEGTNQIQALCPDCDYAEGYNQRIHGYETVNLMKFVECKKCGLRFVSPTFGRLM